MAEIPEDVGDLIDAIDYAAQKHLDRTQRILDMHVDAAEAAVAGIIGGVQFRRMTEDVLKDPK